MVKIRSLQFNYIVFKNAYRVVRLTILKAVFAVLNEINSMIIKTIMISLFTFVPWCLGGKKKMPPRHKDTKVH